MEGEMRILLIFLCCLFFAAACIANADTTPASLADYTAIGGYSIHLTNVKVSPSAYPPGIEGTITNTGKSVLTARISVQYLGETGLPVRRQDFYVAGFAPGDSQQFQVLCPNYWTTYSMTIYPGEQQVTVPLPQTAIASVAQPTVSLTADQLKTADKAISDYWSNYWQDYYQKYYQARYNQNIQAAQNNGVLIGTWAVKNGY
jgi:hypothetical protein